MAKSIIGDYPIPSHPEVPDEGYDLACHLLWTAGINARKLACSVYCVRDREWVTKRGTWPKRLARELHESGIRIDQKRLSQVGAKVRELCQSETDLILRITNVLDWTPGTFGDSGSCFWGCHEAARYLLERENALAAQVWRKGEYCSRSIARCWMIPRVLKGDEDPSWVIFNRYVRPEEKDFSLLLFARSIADVNGFTYYRKVDLRNHGTDGGLLYINGGVGYIVGTTSCKDLDEFDLRTEKVYCTYCDRDLTSTEGDLTDDGEPRCDECGESDDPRILCTGCDEFYPEDDLCCVEDSDALYCASCVRTQQYVDNCAYCTYVWNVDMLEDVQGEVYCPRCVRRYTNLCNRCEARFNAGDLVDGVCNKCAEVTISDDPPVTIQAQEDPVSLLGMVTE